MSLSGTFETLAITDVLGLLAGSGKSGALRLEAGGATGAVYLVDGLCCAAETDDLEGAVESEKDLEARLLEVCFEVARHEGGSFAFEAEATPEFEAPHRVDVTVAVAELDDLLEQWHEVQQVVPSLEHRPRLDPQLETETVEFDRERWKLLVAVDGRRSVRQIQQKLGGSVLDVCREIALLVEVGAVVIAKPGKSTSFAAVGVEDEADAAGGPTGRAGRIVPSTPYGPGVDDADPPAPEAEEDDAPVAEVVDDGDVVVDQDAGGHDGPDDDPDALTGPDVSDLFDDERGDAEDVAAAVAALKERGELPEDVDTSEVRDRGALLRLFSALRDS